MEWHSGSRVGLVTQRSTDRNHALLTRWVHKSLHTVSLFNSDLPIILLRATSVIPAIAQLVEHLTVDFSSDQMVPGSIPGGRIFFASQPHAAQGSVSDCCGEFPFPAAVDSNGLRAIGLRGFLTPRRLIRTVWERLVWRVSLSLCFSYACLWKCSFYRESFLSQTEL